MGKKGVFGKDAIAGNDTLFNASTVADETEPLSLLPTRRSQTRGTAATQTRGAAATQTRGAAVTSDLVTNGTLSRTGFGGHVKAGAF